MSIRIEHKGYVVFQAENNHVTLSKNGKWIAHAQCTEKHTEESLHQYADNFLDLLSKLGVELTNEDPSSTVILPKPDLDPKVVNQIMRPARFPSRKEVEQLRKKYPIGTRLYLIKMDDPYAPVPSGTRGSIVYIDDAGQIHMDWDNGRTLPLIPGVDDFRKLTAGEEQLEEELKDFCIEMLTTARICSVSSAMESKSGAASDGLVALWHICTLRNKNNNMEELPPFARVGGC